MVVGDRKSSQSQKVFIALAAAFFVFYYLPVAATAQHITIKATEMQARTSSVIFLSSHDTAQ
jgi:hypothetical protein